jgi:hypothetical protein
MKRLSLIVLLFAVIGISSCKKSVQGVPFRMTLTATAPGNYSEINMDIIGMQVQYTNEPGNWTPVRTMSGLYNMDNVQDPASIIIADDQLQAGAISQIRFVLGNNSNVTDNGTNYPMAAPSYDDPSLVVNVNRTLQDNSNNIALQFDSQASVINDGGVYRIVPVFTVK